MTLAVARDANVINDSVYTMLVIMAVITTAMAGPLLSWVYPQRWLDRDIAEANRRRTNAARDRVAVVVDDADSARPESSPLPPTEAAATPERSPCCG